MFLRRTGGDPQKRNTASIPTLAAGPEESAGVKFKIAKICARDSKKFGGMLGLTSLASRFNVIGIVVSCRNFHLPPEERADEEN